MTPAKSFEYLMRWCGRQRDGSPWPDSWHDAVCVTPDLIEAFEATIFKASSMVVNIDVAPLFEELRRTTARAVAIDKTHAEPLEHLIPCDAFLWSSVASLSLAHDRCMDIVL